MAIPVQKTLSKALAAVLEDPRIGHPSVYLADPDKAVTRPAPPQQFTTVLLASVNPLGQPNTSYVNQAPADGVDLIETYSQVNEIMFSVQAYRGNAADRIKIAELAVRQTWAREIMLDADLAFVRMAPARDLTEEKDGEREQRYQFDVYYHTVHSLTDTILAIESIDINGVFSNSGVETPVNIQVRNP